MDGAGNLYVGNYTANNVVKIAAGGGSASIVSTGGITLFEACGVALDGAGNLFIADYGNSRIVLVTSAGSTSIVPISGLAQAISTPAALAFDGAGNLYIADYGNGRVVKVTPAGVGTVVATGSYSFGTASVTGVAVDGNGNLYIADSGHRRVVQLTTAGVASVLQTPGQTLGTLLFGLTSDNNGNIYVADWSNNRVMKVNVTGSSLSFANTVIGATSTDSPKTATVTNMGNEALAFSANPSYTANFSENTSDTNPCVSTTTLDPGEVCDVSVLFTPHSAGSLNANVVVTNNHLNESNATQTIAVNGTGVKASPSITLDSSAHPAPISTSITLTTTVASSVGTPTGSVDFYDGTTLLGSNTLASGVATYATTSLAAGTHTITAVYAGDTHFLSVTSSAVSQVVTDLTIDVASGGISAATISAGETATYHLTIAPATGSVLPAVALSASGEPAGSTITITPQTIAAGAAATDVTVTVQVPATSAAVPTSNVWALGLALPLIGVFALPLGIEGRRLLCKRALLPALLLMALVSMVALLGCGGSSSYTSPHQPTNYTVTVTATSGSVSHATALTLTVR